MLTLERAFVIAEEAHRGKYDWYGQPYITHPVRVMVKVRGERLKIIAVLHDVIEDTDWTFDMLRAEGADDQTIHTLDCLTRREGESYGEYMKRVMSDRDASEIKICDLEDNLDITRQDNPLEERDLNRISKYHKHYLRLKKHLYGSHK